LRRNLNAKNPDGLTPAHMAIKTNPVALWWLMELKAALTTDDYSRNILTAHPSKKNINESPLECIFKDDETAKNVFWQMIKSSSWEFFDLFKGESPEIREKYKKYLKYISQEFSKPENAKFITLFNGLFQSHWKDILDEAELSKVTRLIDALEKLNWTELLGREDWSNTETAKEHILTNCSLLYLNKFSDNDIHTENPHITLKSATLEQMLMTMTEDLINNEEFQAIKSYVEGLPDNPSDNSKTTELKTSSQLEQDNLTDDKENISSAANQTFIVSKSIKPSSKLKPKIGVEILSEHMFEIFQGDQKYSKIIKDHKYSKLHSLIFFASGSNKNSFNKLLDRLASIFKAKIFKDMDVFFEEYIKTLQPESLKYESIKLELNGNNEKLTAYDLACKNDNDKLAKLLVKRGIELEVYNQETHDLFKHALKYKCKDTIQYLLSEVSHKVDWCSTLHQAFKYTNIDVVKHYTESNLGIIKDTTDKYSKPLKDGEYTLFNKSLSVLRQLSRSLVKGDIIQDDDKVNNIKKTSELCEIIDLLIKKESFYYGSENDHIVTKTYELLSSIKRQIARIEESFDKIVSDIQTSLNQECKSELQKALDSLNNTQSLIFENYSRDKLKPEHLATFQKLESGETDDAVSLAETSNPDLSMCSTIDSQLSESGLKNGIDGNVQNIYEDNY